MVFRLIPAACLLLMLQGCSSLFFFPMDSWVQNPARQGLDYEDVVLIHPDGLRIHGWWLPAEGATRGTVYFLHGNAQNISTHMMNVHWLPERGYNVFLLDYRGYGLSEGDPDIEGAQADIQLGLEWLAQSRRLDGAPLVLFGQSLGGSMATGVLSRERNDGLVDCVMLEAPFASYRDVASDVMARSWLLWPLRWMVIPTLPARAGDPERHVAELAPRPLLVLHSEEDPVVPYQQGRRLYAAAAQPKTFQALKGGHSQSVRDPAVRDRLLAFLQENECAARPQAPTQEREPASSDPQQEPDPASGTGVEARVTPTPTAGGYRF